MFFFSFKFKKFRKEKFNRENMGKFLWIKLPSSNCQKAAALAPTEAIVVNEKKARQTAKSHNGTIRCESIWIDKRQAELRLASHVQTSPVLMPNRQPNTHLNAHGDCWSLLMLCYNALVKWVYPTRPSRKLQQTELSQLKPILSLSRRLDLHLILVLSLWSSTNWSLQRPFNVVTFSEPIDAKNWCMKISRQ